MKKRDMSEALGASVEAAGSAIDARGARSSSLLNPATVARAHEHAMESALVEKTAFSALPHEMAVIEDAQRALLKRGRAVTKSELVRVGLRLMSKLSNGELQAELDALPVIKQGARPKAKTV